VRFRVTFPVVSLLLLAAGPILAYNSIEPVRFGGTFTIPEGRDYFFVVRVTLTEGQRVYGDFRDVTGTLEVFVHVCDDTDYRRYVERGFFCQVEQASGVSGSFSLVASVTGPHYVVFEHYSYRAQTQHVQATVRTSGIDPLLLLAGIALLVPGFFLLYLWRRTTKHPRRFESTKETAGRPPA